MKNTSWIIIFCVLVSVVIHALGSARIAKEISPICLSYAADSWCTKKTHKRKMYEALLMQVVWSGGLLFSTSGSYEENFYRKWVLAFGLLCVSLGVEIEGFVETLFQKGLTEGFGEYFGSGDVARQRGKATILKILPLWLILSNPKKTLFPSSEREQKKKI